MNSRYCTPVDRDEYLFDVCQEAGLDLTDPGDWVNIGILLGTTSSSIEVDTSPHRPLQYT